MTLDDLTWIASTSDDRDDTDLYFFCRDLAQLPGIGVLSRWETIDAWELWRTQGKTLHRAGATVDFLQIAPHWAEAEWIRAADHSWVEAALAELDYPGLLDWDTVDPDGLLEVIRWT